MIHLISRRLHQNKTWKSFIPIKSRRHSRGKLSPKPPPLPPCLQLNLQEAFLALGLQALESEREHGLTVQRDVRWGQTVARCFPPEHGRLCPASACSGISHLSADGARLMFPSSLVLPDLEKWLWNSLASSKEAAHEGSRVPNCTASIHTRDTQHRLGNGSEVMAEVKFAEKIGLAWFLVTTGNMHCQIPIENERVWALTKRSLCPNINRCWN